MEILIPWFESSQTMKLILGQDTPKNNSEMKKYIALVLTSLLINFSSCKKYGHQYPEDPGKTEKTSIERLTNKWWKLKQTIVNGKDYTDTVENAIGEYQLFFSSNIESAKYLGSFKTSIEPGEAFVWSVLENYDYISMTRHHTNSPLQSYAPLYYFYNSSNYGGAKILKLTETEFKITSINQQSDTVVTNLFAL